LPAGSYLLNFTSSGYIVGGTDYLECAINESPTSNTAIMLNSTVNDGRGYIALQKSITLTTSTAVSANCKAEYGGRSLYAQNSTLSAVRVSAINP
jgi:hypothetical protein